MEFKDYYKTLGVARDATQDEIQRAYRKLARKYHPDVSKEADAEARFKDLGEAYEVLKDPEKRAAYARLGANWKAGQDFRPPPDWDQGFEFHGGGFTAADASQFSDFFESLFGERFRGASRGRAGFQVRGQDTYATVAIDLEDAYHGVTRSLNLQHSELGPDGRPRLRERVLNVRIPKGVYEGQHIRLARQGSPGAGGGEAGDLYLEVRFRPHPIYKVEGKDVYLELPVAPWEAALGTTVKTPTPAGTVELKVPPGTPAGRTMRLRKWGIPAKPPGDLYATIQIALPPADSESAKAAYQALAKAQPFNPRKRLGV